MKYLIRFEDKYGMFDLFCMLNKFDFPNTEGLSKLSESIHAQNGLSINRVFIMNNKVKKYINKHKIDKVVFVFDLDNPAGDKTKLMTLEQFDKSVFNTIKELDELGVEYGFIPVSYSAETIGLYSFIDSGTIIPEYVVHKDNTNALHLYMLALLSHRSLDKSKQFRDYINTNNLVTSIYRLLSRTDVNKIIKGNILRHFSNISYMSLGETREYIKQQYDDFKERVCNTECSSIVVDGNEVSLHLSIDKVRDNLFGFQFQKEVSIDIK